MTNALLSDLNKIPDPDPEHWIDLAAMLEAFERQILQHALNMAGGNKALAAKYCKLNRTTFVEKCNKFNIIYDFDQAELEADFKHRLIFYARALRDRADTIDNVIRGLNEAAPFRKKQALSIVG